MRRSRNFGWSYLDSKDKDLSGSGPLVIDAPSMTPSALLMAQGKDGYLYLVDRGNLGGIASMTKPANVGALKVQSGEISNGGAWATIGGSTYVVVRPNGNDGAVGCPGGTSGDLAPIRRELSITSSDGTNDPMVWVSGAGGSNNLLSWDLVTGAPVFTGGSGSDGSPNVRRFTTPIAVHGRIFVGGDGQLYAYKSN